MKIDKYTYFVSGAEPDNYFEMIMQETNTCLMSYQILQRKGKKFLHNRISKFPEMKMLLDSGAHTFIQHKEEYENKDWEEYLGKYTAFIRANKNNILAAAELDIDDLVGTDKVNEWRERYFEPLEKEGVNIIYVWHGKRGLDEWERMCKKYSYVGISLNEKGVDFSDTTLNRMFNTAKKYKTMIHGFAVAGSKELMKFPFTTSDSSTWLVGTQFGEINYFDGRTMMRLKKDKWKRQYKNKLIKAGAKWKILEREDAYEMQRMCLVAFIDMEKHIQKAGVDYIQLVFNGIENRVQDVGYSSSVLRSTGRQLGIPLLVGAQLSREIDRSAGRACAAQAR
jgi:hypothetical protein